MGTLPRPGWCWAAARSAPLKVRAVAVRGLAGASAFAGRGREGALRRQGRSWLPAGPGAAASRAISAAARRWTAPPPAGWRPAGSPPGARCGRGERRRLASRSAGGRSGRRGCGGRVGIGFCAAYGGRRPAGGEGGAQLRHSQSGMPAGRVGWMAIMRERARWDWAAAGGSARSRRLRGCATRRRD